MRKAKVGVIGAGWWSTEAHIPSLKGYEKADLVGIADPKPDKLNQAADYYEVEGRYNDYQDLLAVPGLEGVVIAIPHAFHYQVARDALDGGIHVMVEKPMVLRASEAWDLVRRADEKDLHLSVGYTFQHTRHARRAREIVQSGAIGDVRLISGLFASMVESYYRGRRGDYHGVFEYQVTMPESTTYSDPEIAGGGQGQTQITHAMGMAFWVTGLRATEVFAFMESFDLAVDLVDAVSYRMENGGIGTMGATGSLRPDQPQDQGFIYYGSQGFLRQDMINGKLDAHYNDGTSEQFPDLVGDEIYPTHATSRSLVDQILGEGENLAPGKFGAHTVEFLEAAYRSAESGSPVRTDSLV